MALRRGATTGLRLLVRSQDAALVAHWKDVLTGLDGHASQQIFPACTTLLRSQHTYTNWDEGTYGSSRNYFTSSLVHQSAQPALAQPTEEEQEESRQRQTETPSTSSAASGAQRTSFCNSAHPLEV